MSRNRLSASTLRSGEGQTSCLVEVRSLAASTKHIGSEFEGLAQVVPFPVGAVPAEADFAARARFERRLGLQSHTLRNPITLLSVFAPVLTGAVSSLFTG